MPFTRVFAIGVALLAVLALETGCQKQARSPASCPTKRADAGKPVDENAPVETMPSATTERRQNPRIDTDIPVQQQDKGRTDKPIRERVAQPEKAPSLEIAPRRKPKRPTDSWVIFREALKPREDAMCEVMWTSGNRLEVHTDNISRITLDLTRLPLGAPTKGPWNLQIDGQGIEITGFRPKKGYTGRIRDLVRSKNGRWTVDRKKLYRERG